jgi:class 3 adenylate cyclase/tetratricopeptide (TPR) repeat protein
MRRDGHQGDTDDFQDSFLQELVEVELPFRVPAPGSRIGGEDGRRYEVLGELGRGAMGLVLRAWDSQLHRKVALKLLQPTLHHEQVALSEAQSLAQSSHVNIVGIFDFFEWTSVPWEPRVPFLVMECLEGESLEAVMRRGRLSLPKAMEYLSAITAGLAHAHERHIVHRDLKPGNVFITRPEGTVKLLDFGLSQRGGSLSPGALLLPTAGTPAYMAPEQWRGEAQDARTDIWALGVMLYEMLTGELPYAHLSFEEFRQRVLSTDLMPSVREHCPEVPWELEALLNKALAKDPARRFGSAVELRERLHDIEERLGPWQEAARPMPPQRRQVTLASCWLAGLGNLAAHLDTEDLSELEAAFHQCCAAIIHQHGGSIIHFAGDEVLACFGCALARENDSECAVRAGFQLAQNLQGALHERMPHLPRELLAVQVALHTDFVTLEAGPQAHRGMGPSLLGEAPKLTAWLAKQARPGAVLLSHNTWSLVGGNFQAEPLGPHDYPGALGSQRILVHRVLREHRATLRFDRTLSEHGLTPLIGRERELRTLLGHWEQALQGQGRCVFLSGEPGIGKSRLIQELRARVCPASNFRFRLQCWAQSVHTAFHPLLERLQLASALEGTAPQRLRQLRERMEALGLAPEHMELIGALLVPPAREPISAVPGVMEQFKEKTFEALRALLLRLAQERPVLLIVEDLHWADPSTRQFLGYLIEHFQQARVLLVLSARPEFSPTWHPRPWLHPLSLGRLRTEDTSALVQGVAKHRFLAAETIQQLVRKTDGIPLFIEEMTRMVLERSSSGQMPHGNGGSAIPLTLHELLLARLDMLPRRQKALAQLAAVIGSSFTVSLLAALSGRSRATLQQDVAGLLEACVLQQREETPEPGYQFRHMLLQEAAYQSLPRSTRRQHHRRTAQVLAEQFPQVGEGRPELLAYHYTEAGAAEPAIHYWALAGERASRRSANAEAIHHLEVALKLLRTLPATPQRDQQELRLLNTLGIPLALLRRYRSPELEQLYKRIHELLQGLEELPQSLDLSHWGHFHYHFACAKFSQANDYAEQLVRLGERHRSSELLSLGHRMKATLCFTWGSLPTALEHIERALVHSDVDLEQQRVLAVKHWANPRTAALAYAALIHSVLGHLDVARGYGDQALALARNIGHPYTSAYALTHVALACILRREPLQALQGSEACIALSREHRLRLWIAWCSAIRAVSLARLGRPSEGLSILRRHLAEWQGSGVQAFMPLALGLRAEVHLQLGQPQEGLADVDEALRVLKRTGERYAQAELHRYRGELLHLLGRQDEALRCLLLARVIARRQHAGLFALRATVSLARHLEERGQPQAAERRLRRACARFPPGVTSVDLTEARELLARLSPAASAHEPPLAP